MSIKKLTRMIFMSAITVFAVSGISTALASGSISFNTSSSTDCSGCRIGGSCPTSCQASCASCNTGGSCPDICQGINASNGVTGPNSINKNDIDVDESTYIKVENEAVANNDFAIAADAGFGNITNNTSVGDIAGGDINGDLSVVTELNSGSVNLVADNNDDISVALGNCTTGPDSININKVNVDRRSMIKIENEAIANNNLDLAANTGANRIANNTCVGDISTGDIDVSASFDTTLNAGAGNITIPMSMPQTSVNLSNGVTGPYSENKNVVDIDSENCVKIENEAEVNNDFNIDLNSGDNKVGHNTVVGDISTGDVSFSLDVVTNAN